MGWTDNKDNTDRRTTMRRTLLLAGLGLLALGGGLRADDTKESFVDKSLKGWEGLTEYWTYKDGVLTGAAPKGLKFNTFLCSKKHYGDFELSFKVRLTGKNANSGVQIRSAIFKKDTFAVAGPQCDMGQVYWGSLYGEHFGGK